MWDKHPQPATGKMSFGNISHWKLWVIGQGRRSCKAVAANPKGFWWERGCVVSLPISTTMRKMCSFTSLVCRLKVREHWLTFFYSLGKTVVTVKDTLAQCYLLAAPHKSSCSTVCHHLCCLFQVQLRLADDPLSVVQLRLELTVFSGDFLKQLNACMHSK